MIDLTKPLRAQKVETFWDSDDCCWRVLAPTGPQRSFTDKSVAQRHGRSVARRLKIPHVIYNKSGSISHVNSYEHSRRAKFP